jgi:sigma-54 dependent transcriptional regulator, acetoin dehydrogenase operon transcriptional activator AcoR
LTLPLRAVYRAREEFLSEGRIREDLAVQVRPEVLTSWRRSRLSGASPDVETLHYEADDVADSPLCAAAEPVLARLADRFSGLRAGVLLSDRNARILRRWVAPDSGISREMDRIASIVGSSGSEQFVGTNGIGTVAEDRRARMVVGPEHFAEALTTFTCVGAPIHNPLTHKLEGVVTLNSDVEAASPLLTPLITSTAQEIEQRLLDLSSLRERMLLDTFLTANRSGASVAVVGEDVFMAGPRAARLLDGADHTLIWQHVSQLVSTLRSDHAVFIPTATGAVAVRCSPLLVDGRLAGALLEVDDRPDPPAVTVAPVRSFPRPAARLALPGQSAAWQAVLNAATAQLTTAVPLVVFGEPGTGKLTVVRAMFGAVADAETAARDVASLQVIDCITAAEDVAAWLAGVRASLGAGHDVVVLRHLDLLDDAAATALSAHFDDIADLGASPRVVATAAPIETWAPSAPRRRLLDQLAIGRIDLPALRERREDVRDLVAQIVTRHAPHAPLRISQGALLALTRAQWPGNVRQLESVVRGLVATAGMREVTVEMLPAGLGVYSSRRELTTMEQLELDAITSAIKRSEGNKVVAAKLLGISRSTLYRKMRSYRLDPDKHFF